MESTLIKDDVTNYFDVYRCTPELSVNVPPQYQGEAWNIRIDIAAVGGGTVGKYYGHGNQWIYAVYVDGVLVYSGADLRSAQYGKGATHLEMIATLCSFIHAYAEEDSNEIPEVLKEYGERIGALSIDWRELSY